MAENLADIRRQSLEQEIIKPEPSPKHARNRSFSEAVITPADLQSRVDNTDRSLELKALACEQIQKVTDKVREKNLSIAVQVEEEAKRNTSLQENIAEAKKLKEKLSESLQKADLPLSIEVAARSKSKEISQPTKDFLSAVLYSSLFIIILILSWETS